MAKFKFVDSMGNVIGEFNEPTPQQPISLDILFNQTQLNQIRQIVREELEKIK